MGSFCSYYLQFGPFFIMKKETQKVIQLREKMASYKLNPLQIEGVIAYYKNTKGKVSDRYDRAVDQAILFKNINSGKKVREFKFIYKDDCDKKRGVYKLSFDGNGFYIGRSKYIATRFKSHWTVLHNYFKTKQIIPEHFMKKAIDYLNNHPMAYFFTVELLDQCDTIQELVIKEQKWLDHYKDNSNCLNIGFESKPSYNEIDETIEEQRERKTSVIRRGGRTIFLPTKKKQQLPESTTLNFNKFVPELKKVANEYSFNVPEINSKNPYPVVFKLYYGDRYIIHKGKYLGFSIQLLQRNYGYFLAYKHDEKKSVDFYTDFYNYITKNDGLNFRVEVIHHNESAFEILKKEHELLNECIKDKKCKNGNVAPYIPKFNEKTKMYNWMSEEDVEKYYIFAKSI